jgi:two-component system osmolarity sensor histidine kinase EnvZ
MSTRSLRLWPATLLGRTFSLTALLLIVAAAGWAFAFRAHQEEPRIRHAATFVVSTVTLSRSALISAQPELLRDLLREFADYEGIRIYPADTGESLTDPPADRYLGEVIERVRAELGESTRFAIEREGRRGFFVSFAIANDQYWAEFPLQRVKPPLSEQWIGWVLAALALALLTLYGIIYRIRGPLSALTSAARRIGQGERPAALVEQGPLELRELATAFNQMSSDLARVAEDRALLLAGVSHDLRTPLTRLRLAIEMMAGDPASREGMIRDIDDMNRIVGQFLDFSRALSGEAPVPTRIDLLGQDLVEAYARHGHRIQASIEPVPEQPVRPVALRRMLTNLIDNALRYGQGEIDLDIRHDPGAVIIEVRDRGPGIPVDQTERVRQPFQRLESARSNSDGSGLGLTIVDRIAKAHGGRLDLLAREGGGLTARLTLPARLPPVA